MKISDIFVKPEGITSFVIVETDKGIQIDAIFTIIRKRIEFERVPCIFGSKVSARNKINEWVKEVREIKSKDQKKIGIDLEIITVD